MKFVITLILTLISALLYRLGGMSQEEAKKNHIPLFLAKSWVRDWLLPGAGLGIILTWKWISFYQWGWFLLYYPLTGFAFSTYWDKLFGEDNFYMHGFMIGLASFALFFCGIHWWSVLISAVACGGLMGWLSARTGNVWKEECGRGAIYALTRLLLLI